MFLGTGVAKIVDCVVSHDIPPVVELHLFGDDFNDETWGKEIFDLDDAECWAALDAVCLSLGAGGLDLARLDEQLKMLTGAKVVVAMYGLPAGGKEVVVLGAEGERDEHRQAVEMEPEAADDGLPRFRAIYLDDPRLTRPEMRFFYNDDGEVDGHIRWVEAEQEEDAAAALEGEDEEAEWPYSESVGLVLPAPEAPPNEWQAVCFDDQPGETVRSYFYRRCNGQMHVDLIRGAASAADEAPRFHSVCEEDEVELLSWTYVFGEGQTELGGDEPPAR